MVSLSTEPAGSPVEQVVQRGVLGVDRQQPGAGGLRERADQLAAHHERLLVGQRDVDPLAERDDGRPEAGGADDRVDDEVGVGVGDEPDEALGAGQHLALGPHLGRAGRGVGVRQRDPADPVRAGERDELGVRGPRREPDELEALAGAGDDVERLGSDRARRAEDEQPRHEPPIVAAGAYGAAKPGSSDHPWMRRRRGPSQR